MKLTRTNDLKAHALKIVCHGESAAGKTRLAATTGCLDETIIISAEAGLLSLRDVAATAIEVGSKADVLEAYAWITESDEARGIQWICVDSLSEIAEVLLADEKSKHADGRRAYGEMADIMTRLIRSFRDLPGKHVYMSCKQERIAADMGRMLYAPSMPGNKLAQQVPYFFDEVFALRVHRDDESGEIKRWLQCHPDGSYSAKDRSGVLEMYEAPNLAAIKTKILGD